MPDLEGRQFDLGVHEKAPQLSLPYGAPRLGAGAGASQASRLRRNRQKMRRNWALGRAERTSILRGGAGPIFAPIERRRGSTGFSTAGDREKPRFPGLELKMSILSLSVVDRKKGRPYNPAHR
jgi:hypothetical protein